MGKTIYKCGIFNSYVKLPEGFVISKYYLKVLCVFLLQIRQIWNAWLINGNSSGSDASCEHLAQVIPQSSRTCFAVERSWYPLVTCRCPLLGQPYTSGCLSISTWWFLKMWDPQVTIGFNTKMVKWLDDLGVAPWLRNSISGWWFQTFFIFHNIWDNPSHLLSYFSRWLKPPTSMNPVSQKSRL